MDRERRDQKIAQLKTVSVEKNLVVVFATNDFEEIFAICDNVAILHRGKILEIGSPREVYENPTSTAVAVATGRNNIIKSRRTSSSKADAPQFVTIDGQHLLFAHKTDKINLAPINQDTFLAIRPEHISISFGASFPEDNLLKAEITEIKYLGANTLLHLNAGGLALKALVLRLVGLNVGDECMVGLPPDRILVLKD
jgi:ABC-type Fe3+/spermidine/putrescine transport system ATPase subunit